ncbi:MAG TPA: hypothetical protein PLK37_04005, partial [Terricaulis sp.]|nr:hypothetical protein [Terricaulis sp.]
MSRYQNSRARRPIAWARRPSLAARLLGETPRAPPANDAFVEAEPPFDPPDEDDDIFHGGPAIEDGREEADDVFIPAPALMLVSPAGIEVEDAPKASAPPPIDDEPPFDAPDERDDVFGATFE